MGILIGPGYNASTGSSSGNSLSGYGAGPMVSDGAGGFIARPYHAIEPVQVLHPDGLTGPPLFRMNNLGYLQLGALIGANGAVTTDQPFEIKGCLEYIIDEVVFCHSTGAPGAMRGQIYTRKNKGGETILAAPDALAPMTGEPYSVAIRNPDKALRAADFLYFSPTVANATAITFDIYVFGRVTRPVEG